MTDSNDDRAPRATTPGTPEHDYRLGLERVAALQMDDAYAAHSRAADAGHVGGLIEQGRMRLFGVGTDVDVAGAAAAFERAEAAGNAVAAYFLASIGLGGRALPRDPKVGERLLRAVQAGHVPALRAAAIHFGRKPDLQDQALAARLLDHAAGRGDAIAAQLLAERLRRGEGVTANPDAAEAIKARLREGGFPELPQVVAVPAAPRRTAPPATITLDEVLEPPRRETVLAQPAVARMDGLLSVDECRALIAAATPLLVSPGAGQAEQVPGFDPVVEDFALRLVQLRLAVAAGQDLANAERLVVTRLRPGDACPPLAAGAAVDAAGKRLRTVVAWLATPPSGAAFVLPGPGVSIEPKAGSAVVVELLDGEGRLDPAATLTANAVERGEAWIATLHLRERACRAF